MDKKNIKLITYTNYPEGGASANFLKYLTLSLSLEKNNVEVILPTGFYYGNHKNDKKTGRINDVTYRYLTFINHPTSILGKIISFLINPFFLFIALCKSKVKKELDYVILYNCFFQNLIVLLFAKLFLSFKLIVVYPEFYEKPNSLLGKLKWNDFYLGIRYLSKYTDGDIVLTNYLKEYLIKQSKNTLKKILILPNIMSPEFFESKNESQFIPDKITIGYTGTPTRKDGINDLLKSFSIIHKKYPDTHLLIVGDITNGNSVIPNLKKIANELGIENNVTFTGLVPFSKIPSLLNSCQILALTRPKGVFSQAGFPTKLGEYFSCMKPVLITKVGDIPLYFKDSEHVILVEPDNIHDIVDGFEKLIVNPQLGKKISSNAYKWMNEELNYKNVSNKLNSFVNGVK